MTKYISGFGHEVDITPENEAAFNAAGWSKVDEPKKKGSRKSADDDGPESESPSDEPTEQ